MSDIQRIRNLTDDSSLGSFKNEVIMSFFFNLRGCYTTICCLTYNSIFTLADHFVSLKIKTN